MKSIYIIFALVTALTMQALSQNQKSDSVNTMKVLKTFVGDRKITMTRLNKKETKELIKNFHGILNKKLSNPQSGQIYILNDGRLVISHEGGGMMYESQKDLEDLRLFHEKTYKPHPFYDGLPYGVYYLTHIDTIINEFSQKIGIPMSELDKSIESLYKIEAKLKPLKLDAFELQRDWLLYVMTYCGEVIRQKTGGNWALHELHYGEKIVYEPYIVLENRREYTPLYGFLEEINEHPERLSIAITTEAEIGKYDLYDYMQQNRKDK